MLTLLRHSTTGYYFIRIVGRGHRRLFSSNDERLFVISQLKTLLEYRARVSTIPLYRQVSMCIDLCAYAISENEMTLALFTLSKSSVHELLRELLDSLREYRYTNHNTSPFHFHQILEKLAGPHDCLATSVAIHALAKDWEYTRYTSIGFYLDERRGDWMRIWRMTQLYEETPENYRTLIHAYQSRSRHYKAVASGADIRPSSA